MKRDENTTRTHSELESWLSEERKKLQDTADFYAAALATDIAEKATAIKEFPQLVKALAAKKILLETLPVEVSELEGRLLQAERAKDDDETGSFSRIKRARDSWERAKWQAESFVGSKMEELKQVIQG